MTTTGAAVSVISDFISKVQAVHKTGAATEHSYRSALETLLSGLEEGTTALNEPKRVKCGAPDFIVQRGEIVVGHVGVCSGSVQNPTLRNIFP